MRILRNAKSENKVMESAAVKQRVSELAFSTYGLTDTEVPYMFLNLISDEAKSLFAQDDACTAAEAEFEAARKKYIETMSKARTAIVDTFIAQKSIKDRLSDLGITVQLKTGVSEDALNLQFRNSMLDVYCPTVSTSLR